MMMTILMLVTVKVISGRTNNIGDNDVEDFLLVVIKVPLEIVILMVLIVIMLVVGFMLVVLVMISNVSGKY